MQPFHSVTILPANTPHLSQHQVYLNQSLARSHAARLGHSRRRQVSIRSEPLNQRLTRRKSSHRGNSIAISKSPQNHDPDDSSDRPEPLDLLLFPLPSQRRHDANRNRNWREGRSLQFFITKTATEWASWYDSEFWRVLTPQASSLHSCLRHGLIALGAYHEAAEVSPTDPERSKELKKYTVMHSKMAMSLLFQDHEALPASVKLSTYIVVAAISAFLEPLTYLQALLLQHNFREQLNCMRESTHSNVPQSDWHFITQYLDPSLERQRSKYAQAIDKQWAIRAAHSSHFRIHGSINVPQTFSSLSHSRNILEQILKWTAFQAKTCTTSSDTSLSDGNCLIQLWTAAVNRYVDTNQLSQKDNLTVKILRIAAKISMILITTMDEEDEMAFDVFTPEFRELADVFIEASSCETSRTHVNFGVETSLMALCAGPAVRWCRQPDIRRDFIRSFRATDRHEGLEAAWCWAEIFELTQRIEEQGIEPPPVSCGDIPIENRRRITSLSIFWKAYLLRVRYLRYPYRPTDVEEYWIPHPGWNTMFSSPPIKFDEHCLPDMIYGQGFVSLLRPTSRGEYYTIANPKYYFNLPRV